MKLIHYLYKTKTLAQHGKFTLLALVIVVIAGHLFIPTFHYTNVNRQAFTTDGTYFKYNDDNEVDVFFQSIKNNNGYLCLGTSESVDLNYGNYYEFLNNDTSLSAQFSILAGAGRNCGIYVPIFLQHKQAVKGLKIIYFINPIYWSKGMNELLKVYWERYSSYGMLSQINPLDTIAQKYKTDIDLYGHALNFVEKWNQQAEYYFRQYRKHFFSDLRLMYKPQEFENRFSWTTPTHKNLSQFSNFGKIDLENIDTVWNISHAFHNKEWFNAIDEAENYRYQELTTFVRTCKTLGIECTFIVGPYNERFITHHQPDALIGYKNVTQRIKNLLSEEHVSYIDASDISSQAGAFIDHQHHSSYGAYLIYQKIKTHVQAKEAP